MGVFVNINKIWGKIVDKFVYFYILISLIFDL